MPAIQTIQILGMAGLASYGLARLAAASGLFAYRRYAVVAVPIDGMPAMPGGYRVVSLSAAQLAAHSIDIGPEVQARRFAQGLTCLGAFNAKGVLAGVTWVMAGDFDEDEVLVRYAIPPRCCWDTGLWVAPAFRMSRAFAALWAGTADWMRGQGADSSCSRIADYNLPSLLSHRRMRARTVGHHVFIRLGPWQWAPSARPRLTRVASGQPPVLRLSDRAIGLHQPPIAA